MIIYLVTNTINGKVYVGKTSGSLVRRWKRHCNAAKQPSPPMHLSCAIRQYGSDAFRVEQIASATSENELNELEREQIQKYRSHLPGIGYNHTLGGDGFSIGNTIRAGKSLLPEHKARISAAARYPRSEETKERMRAAQQNRKPITAATRIKMSEAGKGRIHGPMPELQKEKLRLANLGKKRSAATCEAIGRSHRGKALSLEHIEKIRIGLRGKPRPIEVREKIRLTQIGKVKPELQRIHMSEARKGMILTPAHRQHISDSHRARIAANGPRIKASSDDAIK